MRSIRKRASLCPGALYALVPAMLLLSACGGGGSGGGESGGAISGDGGAGSEDSDPNAAPTIHGDPPTRVVAGDFYTFTPTISDADSDPLVLVVEGLPAWATFSEEFGTISGTPREADVGLYGSVSISVSDGIETISLGPFDIEVLAPGAANGAVEISWTPPATNADGSDLTDLTGFRVYWGRRPESFSNSVTIDNPSVDRYLVEGLAPGTYDFAATALNAAGLESRFSSAVSAEIR